MKRVNGYYWVKQKLGTWEIGEWVKDKWVLLGRYHFYDSAFTEINETRILSPEEQVKS